VFFLTSCGACSAAIALSQVKNQYPLVVGTLHIISRPDNTLLTVEADKSCTTGKYQGTGTLDELPPAETTLRLRLIFIHVSNNNPLMYKS
jgi:hypothetical protein